MSKVFFSIIIPTYNAEATLAATLESLVAQTFNNFEVVIVDAVSTDTTLSIANTFHSTLNISLISEKDKGIYDAMNKGIKLAKGEWLYFLGSDDVLFDEHVLQNVHDNILGDELIVYGDVHWLPTNVVESGEWDYAQLLKQNINHQRVFYNKILFEKLGGFNTKYIVCADYDLNIRFFCNPNSKSKYVVTPIAKYHAFGFSADKVDEPFWDDFEQIFVTNFSSYLDKKTILGRLDWYSWYQMQQKKYGKGLQLFWKIISKNYRTQYLKNSISQFKKSIVSK